jgi:hypothetical protein
VGIILNFILDSFVFVMVLVIFLSPAGLVIGRLDSRSCNASSTELYLDGIGLTASSLAGVSLAAACPNLLTMYEPVFRSYLFLCIFDLFIPGSSIITSK